MTKDEHALLKRALLAEGALNKQIIENASLTAQLHRIEHERLHAEFLELGEWQEPAEVTPPGPSLDAPEAFSPHAKTIDP
ncbi:MAG: hypothetical protein ABIR94_21800 [Rubrivivax sp.]